MRGRLESLHDRLFNQNLFASIAQDATVMHIHATAEEFDPAAEDYFATFQVSRHELGQDPSPHTASGYRYPQYLLDVKVVSESFCHCSANMTQTEFALLFVLVCNTYQITIS